MSIRIYKIHTEHIKWGLNYSSHNVAARSLEEALRKVKKDLVAGERAESVDLLGCED